jgi:hypothetical protein
MIVFKRKNRTISLRLSEEEYQVLHRACIKHGARSISDYARGALFNGFNHGLEARVERLVTDFEELTRDVQTLRSLVVQR